MPHKFRLSFEELKANLNQMSSLVSYQVLQAVNSLTLDSRSIYKEIKLRDDVIDAYDELLQIQCENIFALHQPIAYDLRFVISALMINNQLERCGDISVSIANRARKLSSHKNLILESGIVDMAQESHKMISQTIDAFLHSNTELANNVIVNDDKVDEQNFCVFNYTTKRMSIENELVEPLAHILILARQIERLADHAANIAKQVLFLVEAHAGSNVQVLSEKLNTTQPTNMRL
ncbi:MAG: phosphate signaling complex protein PhoU [Bacteroidota bacterium]